MQIAASVSSSSTLAPVRGKVPVLVSAAATVVLVVVAGVVSCVFVSSVPSAATPNCAGPFGSQVKIAVIPPSTGSSDVIFMDFSDQKTGSAAFFGVHLMAGKANVSVSGFAWPLTTLIWVLAFFTT